MGDDDEEEEAWEETKTFIGVALIVCGCVSEAAA